MRRMELDYMPIGSGQMVCHVSLNLLEDKGTVDYWRAKVQLITGTTIIFCHTVLLTLA